MEINMMTELDALLSRIADPERRGFRANTDAIDAARMLPEVDARPMDLQQRLEAAETLVRSYQMGARNE